VLLGAGPERPDTAAQLLLAARLTLGLGRGIARGFRVGVALERLRAEEPHAYVAILGTAPEAQGRGLGSGLLAGVAARCDAQGVPLRLETASEGNLAFYARHGFEIADEGVVAGGGPRLWALRRSFRATQR
jgi:GNAT superfamily N-acetyltransferase